jgi:hypothetical protein
VRKWLIRVGVTILSIAVLLIGGLTWDALDYQTSTGYLSGNNSTSVPAGWPGNTVDQKGRFMDEHNPFLPKTLDLLRWQLGSNQFEAEKRSDRYKLEVKDPRISLRRTRMESSGLGTRRFISG